MSAIVAGPVLVRRRHPWRWSGRNADARAVAKNGWLPLSPEGVLRETNSIGVIGHDSQQFLIATLSSGHPSESDGSQVVQAAGKAAVAVSAVTSFQRPQARQYQKAVSGNKSSVSRRRGSHPAG